MGNPGTAILKEILSMLMKFSPALQGVKKSMLVLLGWAIPFEVKKKSPTDTPSETLPFQNIHDSGGRYIKV